MAVPVEGLNQASVSGAAATSLVVTKQAGAAAGELGIIIIAADLTNASGDEFSTPTGWTKIDEHSPGGAFDVGVASYFREFSGDSGDDSPTISWTTAAEAVAWYIRVSGANNSDPLDGVSTPSVANGTSHPITGFTTGVDECLVFYNLGFDGGDGLPFSVSGTGWSESEEAQFNTAGDTVSATYGTKDQTSAGATGTATVTSTASDGSAWFQFSIQPAVVTGPSFLTILGTG